MYKNEIESINLYCEYFINGNRWAKEYYYNKIQSPLFALDWHVYNWRWLILNLKGQDHSQFCCKMEIKVMLHFTVCQLHFAVCQLHFTVCHCTSLHASCTSLYASIYAAPSVICAIKWHHCENCTPWLWPTFWSSKSERLISLKHESI